MVCVLWMDLIISDFPRVMGVCKTGTDGRVKKGVMVMRYDREIFHSVRVVYIVLSPIWFIFDCV